MSVEDNITTVRRHYDLLHNYDEAITDAIWAEDIIVHEPQRELRGRNATRPGVLVFRDAFPDIKATLHENVAQDDKVAVRYTLTGTHQAPFRGVPATGKRITLSGIGIFRLVEGQIVEVWGCADFLGFLQQLDALPELNQPGASSERRSE